MHFSTALIHSCVLQVLLEFNWKRSKLLKSKVATTASKENFILRERTEYQTLCGEIKLGM